jgi:hypothetical protein
VTKSAEAQKAAALDAILDAWEKALAEGVQSEMLAAAAIYAALSDMVEIYGPEMVAEMCAELPTRVRAGEFTLRPDS